MFILLVIVVYNGSKISEKFEIKVKVCPVDGSNSRSHLLENFT